MLRLFFGLLSRCVSSRRDLLLENLALRQQLAVLKARHPQPRFAAPDKLFWVLLRGLWPGWKQALVLMQPETVVGWHRAGFKLTGSGYPVIAPLAVGDVSVKNFAN